MMPVEPRHDPAGGGGAASVIRFVPRTADDGTPPPFGIDVAPGELVVLTGPPGSGKTAILDAIRGARIAPGALATLGGHDLSRLSHRRRRRKVRELRLAWIPVSPALVSNLSIMENILLPLKYMGEMGERQALQEAFVLLNAAGLGWAAAQLPGSLSAESRRTAALVRGILRRPKAALLDDPFGGLDSTSCAGVRSLLKATMARGECAALAAAEDLGPFEGLEHRTVRLRGEWPFPVNGDGEGGA